MKSLLGYIRREAIIPLALALSVTAGGFYAVPKIKSAYKRSQATKLVSKAESDLKELELRADSTRKRIKNTSFILLKNEIDQLSSEVIDSSGRIPGFENELIAERRTLSSGEYDKVRGTLHPTFGLEKGKSRETLDQKINVELGDLSRVMDYCNTRRNLRDNVNKNELYLIARLKTPYDPRMLEKTEKLALLPKELFESVPVMTMELEKRLATLPAELKNSMGINLLRHQGMLGHMTQFGKISEIKEKAKGMYDSAFSGYRKVRAKNDALPTWYRPNKHDGQFSFNDHAELSRKQQEVINFISSGDRELEEMERYFAELHEQYFEYVSSQDKKETQFAHTVPTMETDSDGNISLGTDTEYEDGWKFYYTLKRVTPEGESSKEIYVGEEEGEDSTWNYNQNEEVGFVREWKRLHYDNTQILSGRAEALNPKIEKLSEYCKPNLDYARVLEKVK